jgi:preprotein translocase subunit SecA
MTNAILPVPGVVLGAYPERRERGRGAAAATPPRHGLRHYRQLAQQSAQLHSRIAALDPGAIAARLQRLRSGLALRGFAADLVAEAFALIDRHCADTVGARPSPTQLIAAAIMLDGHLAEMATGEGKTLATAIAAATAALAGIPVHVMTANDYLVARDAQWLTPLYAALGLRVGAVTARSTAGERRDAYACNVTYCTAREVAFDYLRDRLARGRLRDDLQLRAARLSAAGRAGATLLRGLCMAIIDEADSILIDEAGVPLVLSERADGGGRLDYLRHALDLAGRLDASHYGLDPAQMQAHLTAAGRDALERLAAPAGSAWRNRRHREETACLALAARHLYQRDRHYLVREGRIELIDETTGRLATGRVWSRGLHQLVELKENLDPSGETVTAAQISYQRFFRRYLRLAGSSGTLSEARGELRDTYDLRVVRVPLRSASRRRLLPTRVFGDGEARWQAVAMRARELGAGGRPVLIGTDSVADSEELSQRLAAAGIDHAVLNARQDAGEAGLIAAAGHPGRVTVATNIAGRGTDIPLAAGVAARGGLHVICCQHNSSARIDRQLIGRCARQGDPGSAETLLAADRALLARWLPAWLRGRIPATGIARPQWLACLLLRLPQWRESERRRDQRRALLARDLQTDRGRMFGGPGE